VKRRWIVATVVAAGGALLALWAAISSGGDAAQEKLPAAPAERGSIALTVSATGRVVSNLDVDIKCKASGEVIRLPFDVSDPVKKGELLVELDPQDEARSVRRAEVALSASKARLEQARRNLEISERTLATERRRAEAALKSAEARASETRARAERARELLRGGLASREDFDAAETAAAQAAAELESARARLEDVATQERALEVKRQDVRLAETQVESDEISLADARQRLADTKVYAPMDGVVSTRDVQVGQIISSGISNVGGGTRVLTLSDLSHVYVLASVDESDIGKVRTGQDVQITVDAYPQERFHGKVVRIATRGVSTSNVVTFEVRIEVTGRNRELLKPEMTANVEIVAERRENVIVVPAGAVSRRGGREQVVTVELPDGSRVERVVETGISDGVRVEVVKGVSEGEKVVAESAGSASRWRKAEQPTRTPFMMPGPPGRRPR